MAFLTLGEKTPRDHALTRRTKSRGTRHMNMAFLTLGEKPHVITHSRGEQTKSRGTQNWSKLVFSGRNPIRKYSIENC